VNGTVLYATDRRTPYVNVSYSILFVLFPVDSMTWNTAIGRLIIALIALGKLKREIVDLSIKIRCDEEDELPERVMCCARLVQVDFPSCALPAHVAGYTADHDSNTIVLPPAENEAKPPNTFKIITKCLLVDPCIATTQTVVKAFRSSNDVVVNETDARRTALPQSSRSLAKPSIIATGDPFEKAVNKLIEILEDVRVPMRVAESAASNTLSSRRIDQTPAVPWACSISADKALQARNDLQQVSILRVVSRNDLRRYFVSSNCSLKKATVRVVESAAWRGLTFPVELKACRIELQTGQFFQQGKDHGGRPVFYFRNMCRGPWRGEEDAAIAAVVHRLEQGLAKFAKEDPDVRCTLIVLLGKPKRRKRKSKKVKENASEAASSGGTDDGAESSDDETVNVRSADPMFHSDNPRVSLDEQWHAHTNDRLVRRLVQLVMLHYPERLYRALVVKGEGGGDHTPRTAIGGLLTLANLVDSSNTRRKVKYLRRRRDLQKYVDKEELIQYAGGEAEISPSSFEIQ